MADLEYLTVDSIHWATGHVRSRMAPEEKRAKHRIHQRRFVTRQRLRVVQLRRDLRVLTLQLKMILAIRDTAALMEENEAMQRQVDGDSPAEAYSNEIETIGAVVSDYVGPSIDSTVDEHDASVLELLDMLSDIKTLDADSPNESSVLLCSEVPEGVVFAWSSSPSQETKSHSVGAT